MRSFNIAGIDLSLSNTGITILTGVAESIIISLQAPPSGKYTDEQRYQIFADKIFETIKEYKVKVIIIEGYSFGSKFNSLSLVEIGAVIRNRAFREDIPIIKIPPTSVKKFASGKGNCKKENIILEVYKRWGKEFKTNDEADSYVIAKIGEAILFGGEKLTGFQDDVVKKEIASIHNYYLTQIENLGCIVQATTISCVKNKRGRKNGSS